ncbi:MAG: hypothetical protein WBP64_19305 [Nitrososphaeraceae archaeon]
MSKSTSDRVKVIVQVIEIAEKVTKDLPIIVFSYAGLTTVFAVVCLLENYVVAGIVLCIFAGFGIYLAIRLSLVRIRWKRSWQTQKNT